MRRQATPAYGAAPRPRPRARGAQDPREPARPGAGRPAEPVRHPRVPGVAREAKAARRLRRGFGSCVPRGESGLAVVSRPGPRRPGPGRAGTRRALRRIPARIDGAGDAARVGRAAPAVDSAHRRRRGWLPGGPGGHDPQRHIQQPRRALPPRVATAEQPSAPIMIFCVSSAEAIRDGWRRKNTICSLMITSETPSTRTPY